MEMGGWKWERVKCERLQRDILMICIKQILKSGLQFQKDGLSGVQRGDYFVEESVRKTELGVRMRKLKKWKDCR